MSVFVLLSLSSPSLPAGLVVSSLAAGSAAHDPLLSRLFHQLVSTNCSSLLWVCHEMISYWSIIIVVLVSFLFRHHLRPPPHWLPVIFFSALHIAWKRTSITPYLFFPFQLYLAFLGVATVNHRRPYRVTVTIHKSSLSTSIWSPSLPHTILFMFLMMNHRDMTNVVMESHKVLCFDAIYSIHGSFR